MCVLFFVCSFFSVISHYIQHVLWSWLDNSSPYFKIKVLSKGRNEHKNRIKSDEWACIRVWVVKKENTKRTYFDPYYVKPYVMCFSYAHKWFAVQCANGILLKNTHKKQKNCAWLCTICKIQDKKWHGRMRSRPNETNRFRFIFIKLDCGRGRKTPTASRWIRSKPISKTTNSAST